MAFKKGREAKQRIEKYLDTFIDFKQTILPYIQSENGRKVCIAT